jgi:hypothetical protein
MSDEIQETPGAAVRNLLGAVGFILILLGGEILLDKTGERFALGVSLIAVGVPVFFMGVFWKWLQQRLATGVARKLNFISADPVWWVAIFSVFTTFSLNQLGLVQTLLILALLGIGYAYFEWRKASKARPLEVKTATGNENSFIVAADTKQIETDVLHLLDFGVYQTTLVMLSELVDRIPKIYNVDYHAPFPLNLSNRHAHDDAQVYLQSVRNRICDGSERAGRYESVMRNAEGVAEQLLRSTPQEERPSGIDPLVLRDYAISFRQAVFTAAFLRTEKHRIEGSIISQRRTLIDRYRLRSK